MSVRIRLKRIGTHKKPYYRLVVADSRSPRDGRFIEMVGTYDPLKKPAEIKVDQEKAIDWLKKGAVPSDTVKTLLSKVGVMKQHSGEVPSSGCGVRSAALKNRGTHRAGTLKR
jgi:small subunit ribosomal protein S16